MFLGHGLFAFALVALLGNAVGWSSERALWLGVLAGAFATVPDVDMLYAPIGLLGGANGLLDASEAFWNASAVVHRTVTHSLALGVVAALAYGLVAVRYRSTVPGRSRLAAVTAGGTLLVGLVVTAAAVSGGLAAVVVALFCLAGLAVTLVAARRGVAPRLVGTTAVLGLATHPFGDLFTGEPPAMLYPFDVTIFAERVTLHPDPTLHLLGAFAVELATIWLAAYALFTLTDRRFRDHLSPRAGIGAGYAAAALAIPAPTLSTSYPFVFSILPLASVGVLGATRGRMGRSPFRRFRPTVSDWPTALVTGLTAVTLAAAGYTLAYLVV
ncbi:metal-dependent hydrolase [Halorientalis pallida]|uniref:Hydrolase n=1 Tax=Halorientalis pallida TaxID=2479928 RepID=A0A498KYM1_9EURY|nr:metal-dependent hydrolase [Halorientalis pallida]RXK51128.1 hydrolase [Halorientalis pallida]